MSKEKPAPTEFTFHVTYKTNISDFFSKGQNIKAFSLEGMLQKLKEHTDIKEENILTIINKTNLDNK